LLFSRNPSVSLPLPWSSFCHPTHSTRYTIAQAAHAQGPWLRL
jgi:hypothetical protein